MNYSIPSAISKSMTLELRDAVTPIIEKTTTRVVHDVVTMFMLPQMQQHVHGACSLLLEHVTVRMASFDQHEAREKVVDARVAALEAQCEALRADVRAMRAMFESAPA